MKRSINKINLSSSEILKKQMQKLYDDKKQLIKEQSEYNRRLLIANEKVATIKKIMHYK